MARGELALFLRDRRSQLRPTDVGLPAGDRRRTPGLRREEVAELAHMSVEYYTRMEQARGPRPSARILDGVAQALRLAPAERAHLYRLAEAPQPVPLSPVRTVRPRVRALLDHLPGAAAVVTDATYDVLAWNPLAEVLLGGLAEQPSLARRRFLMPMPYESTGAEEFGHIVAARLRAAVSRYPDDPRLVRLLADLHASEEFTHIWDTRPVHAPGHRESTVDHPQWGKVRITCEVLAVPEDDQQIVFMTLLKNNRPNTLELPEWPTARHR
jgi:transcriptional regulator with XRE-family HTH domain